jgi:hypothetical protein
MCTEQDAVVVFGIQSGRDVAARNSRTVVDFDIEVLFLHFEAECLKPGDDAVAACTPSLAAWHTRAEGALALDVANGVGGYEFGTWLHGYGVGQVGLLRATATTE